MFNFKESKVALDKTQENIDSFSVENIKENIKYNITESFNFLKPEERKGVLSLENPSANFSLGGSYKIAKVNELGEAVNFFKNEDRLYQKGSFLYTRGSRYLSALDRFKSVPQKLEILSEDYEEALKFSEQNFSKIKSQYQELSPVLDYAKNSSITLLNSFVFDEKIGKNVLDEEYLSFRNKIIEAAIFSTEVYYKSLINDCSENDFKDVQKYIDVMSEVKSRLLIKFKEKDLSSRSFVRPEASHPLVILSAVATFIKNIKDPDCVIGMPSGGAELLCATVAGFEYVNLKRPDHFLLPVSLHAQKDFEIDNNYVKTFLKNNENLKYDKVLIVDDNSSTGRTVQVTKDIVNDTFNPKEIYCAVVEVDLIRTMMDIKSEERNKIANTNLYNLSVNVLPVSKHFSPKYDIKELMETRELISIYKKKAEEAKTFNEKIKYEIFAEEIENPTEESLKSLDKEKSIDNFHGTFLSNFYATPVEYNGVVYPSVEHAYQKQKFSDEVLNGVDMVVLNEIKELLLNRGYLKDVNNLNDIFVSDYFTSGNIKLVADLLKNHELVRKDWDDVRFDVMVELVMNKFSKDETLKNLLKETDDKILIEGNDWNDTYWGICDGRGKNFLGRILMKVRDNLKVV